jgi:LPS-assembly protein
MKNKIKLVFLTFILNLCCASFIIAEEFTFKVTDLEILENNTIYKGNNRGIVTTRNNEIVITADTFIYNKLTTLLEAEGNVKLVDKIKDIIIESNKIFYLKDKEKIYTIGKSKATNGADIKIDANEYFKYNKLTSLLEAKGDVVLNDRIKDIIIYTNEIFYLQNEEKISTLGETNIDVESKYKIKGSDLTLLRDKMILSSNEKAIIKDNNSNIYKLDQFQYSIDQEILKGKKVSVEKKEKINKQDDYYFKTGFFNLKENKFLGKDVNINFHKTLFENENNDPRVNAATGYGNEYNTFLDKAVFTSCKKTDKCPPWKMSAKKAQHDKVKKQIIYNNAWLELYDFPVVYFPKFFHPGPSVKRQSGLLRPAIGDHSTLGDSIYFPYFFVISDDKDITLKPRLFNNNAGSRKFILQTEYRQETKNSLTIIDSSITTGHDSSKIDKGDTRSHLFTSTYVELNFDEFINSNLQINYEKMSNDNYLKLFDFIKSPIWADNKDTLESKIELDLEHENYDFTSAFIMYESLGGLNSNRYTYVLPNYNFSKNFFLDNVGGSFNFSSNGNYTINNTNISTSSINNNLGYASEKFYSDNGIRTDFNFKVKNSNSMSDNSVRYKNTPQSELMSAYYFNTSFPLQKNNISSINTLIPKLSFRISPHDMKNHRNSGRRIDINNVFSNNRLSLNDSFETGESLTLGMNFKKEKVNELDKITKIEEYFDFKLATVLRFNKEEHMPIDSTINEKTSNIFGLLNYKPIKSIDLTYNFSLTNDFNTLEYNSIGAEYNSNNFSTKFDYIEEAGILGNTNAISNTTKYTFKEYSSLTFSTRRNRQIDLTEYYDLVYEYKNDCLVAGIKYRKDYYKDADIIPKEELFFSITIVPFYTFSPDKMILNKDRVD